MEVHAAAAAAGDGAGSMSGLLLTCVLMFGAAYLCGMLPSWTPLRNQQLSDQVNAVGAGLLLGSALCIILPEGFEAALQADAHTPTWAVPLALLAGFWAMLVLDSLSHWLPGAGQQQQHRHAKPNRHASDAGDLIPPGLDMAELGAHAASLARGGGGSSSNTSHPFNGPHGPAAAPAGSSSSAGTPGRHDDEHVVLLADFAHTGSGGSGDRAAVYGGGSRRSCGSPTSRAAAAAAAAASRAGSAAGAVAAGGGATGAAGAGAGAGAAGVFPPTPSLRKLVGSVSGGGGGPGGSALQAGGGTAAATGGQLAPSAAASVAADSSSSSSGGLVGLGRDKRSVGGGAAPAPRASAPPAAAAAGGPSGGGYSSLPWWQLWLQDPSHQVLLGLLVHAVSDGLAVGAASLSSAPAVSLGVATAMVVHKGPVAMGLSTFLRGAQWAPAQVHKGVLLFAAASPLAALLTYGLLSWLPGVASNVALAVVFSGGTVLYAATMHILPSAAAGAGGGHGGHGGHAHGLARGQLVLVSLGMVLPLVLGALFHHEHGGHVVH